MNTTDKATIGLANIFAWGMFPSEEGNRKKQEIHDFEKKRKATLLDIMRNDPAVSAEELQLTEEKEEEKKVYLNGSIAAVFLGSPSPELIKARAEAAQKTRDEAQAMEDEAIPSLVPPAPHSTATSGNIHPFGSSNNSSRFFMGGKQVSAETIKLHLTAQTDNSAEFRKCYEQVVNFLRAQKERFKTLRSGLEAADQQKLLDYGVEGDLMPYEVRETYAVSVDKLWNDMDLEALIGLRDQMAANYSKVLKMD